MYFLYINIYIILSTPRVVTVVYVVVKNRQLRGVLNDNRDNINNMKNGRNARMSHSDI